MEREVSTGWAGTEVGLALPGTILHGAVASVWFSWFEVDCFSLFPSANLGRTPSVGSKLKAAFDTPCYF